MQPTINQLVEALEALPASAQERYLRHFLEEIAADARWESTLSSPESGKALRRLADEIEEQIAAGETDSFYDELDKRLKP